MRSIFIAVLMMALLGTTGHAAWAALAAEGGAARWGWLGALLATGGFMGFFVYLFVGGAARTSRSLPGLLALVAAGSLLALYGAVQGGSWLAASYALGPGLLGALLYVFWYSRLDRPDPERLAAGRTLPEFEVVDNNGRTLSSGSFSGQPALWLFYRGNWCPLCMAQIEEVAERYRELAARGVEVLLVSPQPAEHSRKLAARFDVPMRFLVDPGNRAARALGILAADGVPLGMQMFGYDTETVLPTVLLVDAEGRILWSDQTDNYRIRPEPETFLAVLEAQSPPASGRG